MRTTTVDVIQIPTKGPGDVSGLMNLIEAGKLEPASILAILGKTEGNGGVNDFTREYAVSALSFASRALCWPARDRMMSNKRSRLSCRAARKACSVRISPSSRVR